jgi:hypothetical protein
MSHDSLIFRTIIIVCSSVLETKEIRDLNITNSDHVFMSSLFNGGTI